MHLNSRDQVVTQELEQGSYLAMGLKRWEHADKKVYQINL